MDGPNPRPTLVETPTKTVFNMPNTFSFQIFSLEWRDCNSFAASALVVWLDITICIQLQRYSSRNCNKTAYRLHKAIVDHALHFARAVHSHHPLPGRSLFQRTRCNALSLRRKPAKLPLSLGILSPCRRTTEPWPIHNPHGPALTHLKWPAAKYITIPQRCETLFRRKTERLLHTTTRTKRTWHRQHAQKLVKFARVAPEICWQTDRQTHRQRDTDALITILSQN